MPPPHSAKAYEWPTLVGTPSNIHMNSWRRLAISLRRFVRWRDLMPTKRFSICPCSPRPGVPPNAVAGAFLVPLGPGGSDRLP
jgi:hypothetical protein